MSTEPTMTPLPVVREDGAAAPDRKPYEPPRLVVLSAQSTAGKPHHASFESSSYGAS